MRIVIATVGMLVLLVQVVVGAGGSEPRDELLQNLYAEYTVSTEGMKNLTHMGLPIGEAAPTLEGVDFSGRGTAIIFMSEAVLDEPTPKVLSLFDLLAEWGEIPGLQVVAVLSRIRDHTILTALQEIAPCTLTVDDRWNTSRLEYGLRIEANPGVAFFFVDRSGCVVYRWLGIPIFGEAWDSFLSVPLYLAEHDAAPPNVIMQNHPENTLGSLAIPFDFLDLDDNVHVLPTPGEMTVIYFMPAVPNVENTETSAVFARLAQRFSDHASFYAVIPDTSADGLRTKQVLADRGLIDSAVPPEAEQMFGPLPATHEGIQQWLTESWKASTLPEMKEAQSALGIPVLRDTGSQAMFTWGISLFGYRTYLILDEDGEIIAFERIENRFEPLYRYWLEEMIGGKE